MPEKRKISIMPSILSANFANLGAEIKKCEDGGADILHCDIMDGHFVPNITYGPMVVKTLREISALPLDCHLMIENPDDYIPEFAKAGAEMISVHVEGAVHLHRTLQHIKSFEVRAGIAVNPATPMEYVYAAAEYCDYILLMSVNPGFGGQEFIPAFLERCSALKVYLGVHNLDHVDIQVDGGIKINNVAEVVKAGANMIVSGSGLFKGDLIENIKLMRNNTESAIAE